MVLACNDEKSHLNFEDIKTKDQGMTQRKIYRNGLYITKWSEVQEAHFSGKQCALHCSVVEPGENKFVYHLSEGKTHDACFVHQVLEDIFDRWGIGSETVVIKSDNAPTQYNNKWAFQTNHSLADKYNVRIIRLYGAAGDGKRTFRGNVQFRSEIYIKKRDRQFGRLVW